jgi:hypothetical protein
MLQMAAERRPIGFPLPGNWAPRMPMLKRATIECPFVPAMDPDYRPNRSFDADMAPKWAFQGD